MLIKANYMVLKAFKNYKITQIIPLALKIMPTISILKNQNVSTMGKIKIFRIIKKEVFIN